MSLFGSLAKAVSSALGLGPSGPSPAQQAAQQAQMMSAQTNEQVRKKMEAAPVRAARRAKGGARGRESTIISGGQQIQSRTLLG